MPRASSSRARRIVMPLMILLVGGAIAVWVAQQERGEAGDVKRYVREICLAASRGEDVSSRLVVENRALRRPLARMIVTACAPLADDPEALDVDVATEVAGGIDRHRPIHSAQIEVNGHHVLTLLVVVVDDRIIVTGYEQPQTPG